MSISGLRFLIFYSTFISFFIFIMGLGGSQYVAQGLQCNENVTENCLNISSLIPEKPQNDPISQLMYVVNNIGLLFTLMVLNPFHPSVSLLWILMGIPAIIALVYIVLLLIRGGGA